MNAVVAVLRRLIASHSATGRQETRPVQTYNTNTNLNTLNTLFNDSFEDNVICCIEDKVVFIATS